MNTTTSPNRPSIDFRAYDLSRTPEQLSIEQMRSDLAVWFMTHKNQHLDAFQAEFENAEDMPASEQISRLERWLCLTVGAPHKNHE